MAKEKLNEINFIRSIACLCVVLVHSITRVMDLYGGQLSQWGELAFLSFRLFFTFGTPIFIFLSEFLLAYSYAGEVPKGFMKKRIKYILFPYISMAFIYSFIMVYEGGPIEGSLTIAYMGHVIRNLAFGFYRHGYFILVIFQFYFLHMLFHRKLKEWKPQNALLISLLFNAAYLGFFSFADPNSIPYGQLLWKGLSWGSFPAWVFYFVLGYYTGANYSAFKEKLNQHKKIVMALPLITLALVMYLFVSETITINSSKRVDMIFFSTSMIFLLFYLTNFVMKIPKYAPWISGYSFGIYLFHMFYLAIFTALLQTTNFTIVGPVTMLVFLFLTSTTASIFTTYLFSSIPMGSFVVGKVGGGVKLNQLIHNKNIN